MWNSDNGGPLNERKTVRELKTLERTYSNARIYFSTMTDYVNILLNTKHIYNNLPVYDQEIGDTWNHGPSSDPLKLAQFRIMQRHRYKYKMEHDNETYEFQNCSRFVLKCGEHTFGNDRVYADYVDFKTIWKQNEIIEGMKKDIV